MPVSYRIDAELKYISVTLDGIVTDEDIVEGQKKMFSDPLFEGGYSRLIDASEVAELRVTADVVRFVARAAVSQGLRRVALVANSDFVYAMMRMYEGYAYGVDCLVCRDRNEALAWLFSKP